MVIKPPHSRGILKQKKGFNHGATYDIDLNILGIFTKS
jgi:hypothetical protein